MTDYKPTQLMLDWHDALLNPDLTQTKGVLGRKDHETGKVSNCCLGVLAEVDGNVGTPLILGDGSPDTRLVYNGPTAEGDVAMPSAVLTAKVLGLSDPDFIRQSTDIPLGVDVHGDRVMAADLNDDWDFTFAEIAEQIRKVYIEGNGNFRENQILDLVRHKRYID